ncbi:MAG: hypothetical protein BWY02_02927 [bacterium ADurb.Bin157]|nr:MAG: hypothetical protein BWY02_02927 [bacterium ADurb.Bin157]
MSIQQKLLQLKEDGQDYEFYPTTNEILAALEKDLLKVGLADGAGRYWRNDTEGFSVNTNYEKNQPIHTLNVQSFLEIGAGDGRVIDYLFGHGSQKINIKNKLGIELARAQADDLIRRGIGIIGRDYFETVLIDKQYTVVFSNPPYSIFTEWCIKLLKEVNAAVIYLVLPERWKDDSALKQLAESKGDVEIIGSFDFLHADRPARAKVDLIRIHRKNREKKDSFETWIEENIGKFEVAEEVPEMAEEAEEKRDNVEERSTDKIRVLVENYRADMQHMMTTFQELGKIDFKLLAQLKLDKKGIIEVVRSDIKSLKNRYWQAAFDLLKPINSRLTYKTREKMLTDIKWFADLDFSEANLYSIMVWVIENGNKHIKDQLLQVYEDLTNFEGVRAYKSNDKWLNDHWRYGKTGLPSKYSLDYRLVVSIGYRFSKYEWDKMNNAIADLAVVADTLGFKNKGVNDFEKDGKAKYCYADDDTVLFEYKCYQNNNVHFKLKKELQQALNIEAGKLHGWLKNPADIVSEFEVTQEQAERWFAGGSLQLLGKNSPLLIGFGENK